MDPAQNARNGRRKKIALITLTVFVVLGIITVYAYITYLKTHISTDDAFVTGRTHVIAAKVPGTVRVIHVQDNQSVRQGDLLAEVDEQDYDVRVREAASALQGEQARLQEASARTDVARTQMTELEARLSLAQANLRLQEANLRQARADLSRAQALFDKEILPADTLDKARTAHDVTGAQVDAARQQLKQAAAALETQHSLIRQAETAVRTQGHLIRQKEEALKSETLRQSYTKIFAPAAGYITKKTVETGNQIQAGQPLMALVPLDDVWVVANYKETQIKSIRPGLKVEIRVDTFPDRTFEGQVHSIMAGTGAVFSLFPPENATGSYVKVVQRVPVKITLKAGADPDHLLRVGMSVVPTVLLEK